MIPIQNCTVFPCILFLLPFFQECYHMCHFLFLILYFNTFQDTFLRLDSINFLKKSLFIVRNQMLGSFQYLLFTAIVFL